jgi:hypothetical protein
MRGVSRSQRQGRYSTGALLCVAWLSLLTQSRPVQGVHPTASLTCETCGWIAGFAKPTKPTKPTRGAVRGSKTDDVPC